MKKTIHISLNQLAFSIEEDAFLLLDRYLKDLKVLFGNNMEAQEILADVEARLAELLSERVGASKQVINSHDVEHVLGIMGAPEQYELDQEPQDEKHAPGKLFRDPDDRWLGGVCSGLAHYTGLSPLLVRVAFGFAFAIYGAGALAYLLLWVLVPQAMTSSQKLQMKRQTVNLKNIQEFVKDELGKVRENIDRWGHSQSQNNSKGQSKPVSQHVAQYLDEMFFALGKALGGILLIGGFVLMTGLGASFFIGGPFFDETTQGYLSLSQMLRALFSPQVSVIFGFALYFTLIIPIVSLMVLGARLFWNYRFHNRKAVKIVWSFWAVSALTLMVISDKELAGGSDYKEVQHETLLSIVPDSTYHVGLDASQQAPVESGFHFMGWGGEQDVKAARLFGRPTFDVRRSPDNRSRLFVTRYSNGRGIAAALTNAMDIDYYYNIEASEIVLASHFVGALVGQRAEQSVHVVLELAEGHSVYLAPEMVEIIYDIKNVQNIYDGDMGGQTWTMTPSGLSISSEVRSLGLLPAPPEPPAPPQAPEAPKDSLLEEMKAEVFNN